MKPAAGDSMAGDATAGDSTAEPRADEEQAERRPGEAPAEWPPELERLREQIEGVDDRIIGLFVERVALARQVGVAKRDAGLPTLDPRREAAVVRRAGERARATGLQDEDVRYIFWHLIGLCRRAQLEEM